jgi:diguanylate cyclase (GGDEF)-like protein
MGPRGPTWALVVMRDIKLQKRRERRLAHRAMTDSLTGLPNRAGLFDAFGRELKRASRYARRLAVAMVDLDGFKAYNDAYGHLVGDALLKAVAGLLPLGLRATDLVARYGGDEFLLLFPETDAAEAMIMAKRLCQMVAEFPFAKSDALPGVAPPIPVTISAGLAVFPDNGSSHEALIDYADRRLFEAKQQGRSQVMGPPSPTERRRKPRVTLECPVTVRRLAAAPHEAWPDAVLKDISPVGAYFTTESQGQSIMTGDMLLLSLSILPGRQQNLPFSRFAGRGRVMRIKELGHAGSAGQQRVGIAVEFTEEGHRVADLCTQRYRERQSERRHGGDLAWQPKAEEAPREAPPQPRSASP